MNVGEIIIQQLGGNKFVVMTDVKDLYCLDNGLRMSLPKNHSKANRLEIVLNGDDTYTMRFYRRTAPGLRGAAKKFYPEKITEVAKFEHIFFDQLQPLFTQTTWLYTSL